MSKGRTQNKAAV